MNIISIGRKCAVWVVIALASILSIDSAQCEIVAFNMVDKAINYTGTTPITATSGEQIPGGTDNTANLNIHNISFLDFDFDGDSLADPNAEDPTIYYDFKIYTGVPATGPQLTFIGFYKNFSSFPYTGSFVMSHQVDPPEPILYNQPFPADDLIGDGLNEFTRTGVPVMTNPTWSLAIDEDQGETTTTFMQPGVDNFIGFKLETGNHGWIRVQYDGAVPGTLTFLDGAYDDTGAPIAAGDTGVVLDDADFNDDLIVDGGDFLIWQRGTGVGTTAAEGDANGDNVINGADLAIWEGQYGSAPLSAAITQVPEPASVVLLAVCFAVATLRRLR